jgi:proteasome lid subunit RPN8/RPN11
MTAAAPKTAPPPKPVDRDTSFIISDDWPMRELGTFTGFRERKFQVVFCQSVLDEIHLHGQGSNDIEVCGVLIGTGYRDASGPYLLVEHCIRGNGAKARSTNVTFTADTWAFIQEIMDREYADKKMIGWYHTHPGFGIFLSDMDVFICDNFFNLPWQVAFVYDPLSGEEGNFIWKTGKPQREAVLIEEDVTPLSASIPLISTSETTKGTTSPFDGTGRDDELDAAVEAKILELLIRVRRLETRQKKMVAAMVFLATFVIIWAVEFSPVAVPIPAAPTTQAAQQTPAKQAPVQPVPVQPVPVQPGDIQPRHAIAPRTPVSL